MQRSNKSRQKPGMVQKQNLNAPGTMAEYSARMNDAMDNNQLTGASGPDRRLRPWNWGLGHEMLTNPEETVRMSPPPSNAMPAMPAKGAWLKPRGKGASDEIT